MQKNLVVTKLKASEEIRLIDSNNQKDFNSYLEKQSLTKKALKHLFEQGSPKMIKLYVNKIFPCNPEFLTYQPQVIRYADRKTLATYYLYFDVTPEGEIELIKRDEVEPFNYYVLNHGLSPKAFEYLINKGSKKLVETYFNNNSLEDKETIDLFLSCAKFDRISMFVDMATNNEKEDMAKVLKEKRDNRIYTEIYNNCAPMRPWMTLYS